jgi:hypothetical protein
MGWFRNSPREETYLTTDGRTLSTRDANRGNGLAYSGFLGVHDLDNVPHPDAPRHKLDLSLRGSWKFSAEAVTAWRDSLNNAGYLELQRAVARRLKVMGSSAGVGKALWHRVERVIVEERMQKRRQINDKIISGDSYG